MKNFLSVFAFSLLAPALVGAETLNAPLKLLVETSPEPPASLEKPAAAPVNSTQAAPSPFLGLWRVVAYVDYTGIVPVGRSLRGGKEINTEPRYYLIATERGSLGVTIGACGGEDDHVSANLFDRDFLGFVQDLYQFQGKKVDISRQRSERYQCRASGPDELLCSIDVMVLGSYSPYVELLHRADACPAGTPKP